MNFTSGYSVITESLQKRGRTVGVRKKGVMEEAEFGVRHQAKESWVASKNWKKKTTCYLPPTPGPLEPM